MPKSEVFNQDCLEAMKGFPDNHFSLSIVDPPYGIAADNNSGRGNKRHGSAAAISKDYGVKTWDGGIPEANYFIELFRVSKNQIIWGANNMTDHLPARSSWIFWDKDNGNNDYSDGELAFTSLGGRLRQFTYTWHGMIQGNMKNKETRIHPTQKPVALYKWLLTNYAKPGQSILDTHGGSFSSRIAAWDLGFDFVGYESDPDYFALAEERFQRHIAQPKLFEAIPIIETQEGLFG